MKRRVVFFCSDNGAADRWEGRFDSSGQLRGRKRDLYEGGLRVPMLVRWPGKVEAGGVSEAGVEFCRRAADPGGDRAARNCRTA